MFTGNKKEGAKDNPGLPGFEDEQEYDRYTHEHSIGTMVHGIWNRTCDVILSYLHVQAALISQCRGAHSGADMSL